MEFTVAMVSVYAAVVIAALSRVDAKYRRRTHPIPTARVVRVGERQPALARCLAFLVVPLAPSVIVVAAITVLAFDQLLIGGEITWHACTREHA